MCHHVITLTQFVRYLVEDESNHGTNPKRQTLRDGGAKHQPIGKIVYAVSDDDEPGYHLDASQVLPQAKHNVRTAARWFLLETEKSEGKA